MNHAAPSAVVITGHLDIATAGHLAAVVVPRLAEGSGVVGLDLFAVQFIDCAGLGELIRLRNLARSCGADLALRISPAVSRLLELTGTACLFTVEGVSAEPAAQPAPPLQINLQVLGARPGARATAAPLQ